MSLPATLYLRLGNEVRGPFGRERLRELARDGVVTPGTEAAESAAGPWMDIQQSTGWADIFPERPQYQFKAKAFVAVNPRGEPLADHRDLIAAAHREGDAAPAAPPTAAPRRTNEIEAILQENRARQQQAGLDRLAPLPRAKNRRRRDYWIVIIGGNLTIFLALNAFAGPVIAAMLAAFFTASITWVMYGVMDRY